MDAVGAVAVARRALVWRRSRQMLSYFQSSQTPLAWGRVDLASCSLLLLPQAGAQSGVAGRLMYDRGKPDMSQRYHETLLRCA